LLIVLVTHLEKIKSEYGRGDNTNKVTLAAGCIMAAFHLCQSRHRSLFWGDNFKATYFQFKANHLDIKFQFPFLKNKYFHYIFFKQCDNFWQKNIPACPSSRNLNRASAVTTIARGTTDFLYFGPFYKNITFRPMNDLFLRLDPLLGVVCHGVRANTARRHRLWRRGM
jgi:hypothetical protein